MPGSLYSSADPNSGTGLHYHMLAYKCVEANVRCHLLSKHDLYAHNLYASMSILSIFEYSEVFM